jgi:hypothetical protein
VVGATVVGTAVVVVVVVVVVVGAGLPKKNVPEDAAGPAPSGPIASTVKDALT